jgi:hypothetical protein
MKHSEVDVYYSSRDVPGIAVVSQFIMHHSNEAYAHVSVKAAMLLT